ncbi:MAG: class I SAM-dependent methyltransferase [Leptolyngbya sp. SIO1D8]|nr:class I SAM-dependent methyltransferase [Leptolyngbya sp. SIO1D8]
MKAKDTKPHFDEEKPHFNEERATKYDGRIHKLIPGYAALHQMINHLLRSRLPADAHLLVVGAGTGMEIITCGTANPGWTFTAVDPSEAMLTICQDKIRAAGLENRVILTCGNAGTLSTTSKFDAATAILVSHFIQEISEKSRFFTEIASLLKDNATLIVADLQGDKKSTKFLTLLEGWKSLITCSGFTDQEITEFFEHIETNISFVSEQRYQHLLEESSLGHTTQFYKAYLFGGWLCQKQASSQA